MSGEYNLLPCPFGCKSVDLGPSLFDYESGYQTGKRVYEVSCISCGTTTSLFDTAVDAVMMWNSRTKDESDVMSVCGRVGSPIKQCEREQDVHVLCNTILDKAESLVAEGDNNVSDLLFEARGSILFLLREVQMLRVAMK